MPACNDGREGADPKAVSALDCFAPGLAMMTARPTRQPPRLHSLVSLIARTPRNSQIDIIAHSSFVRKDALRTTRQPSHIHSLTSPLARTTRQPPRHWIASLSPAMMTPRTTRQPPCLHSLDSPLTQTTRQPPRHRIASPASPPSLTRQSYRPDTSQFPNRHHYSFATSLLPRTPRQPSHIHSLTSPLARTTRQPPRHWIASPALLVKLTYKHTRSGRSPSPTQNHSSFVRKDAPRTPRQPSS
jgi:hypothetical protein